MLTVEERSRKLVYKTHIVQAMHDRKHLFPFKSKLEVWREIEQAIRDPQRSVIVEDGREGQNSTHICIFVGESGHLIAVPCCVQEEGIIPLTIKDVKADHNNPNWFIRQYNGLAKQRGMTAVPEVVRSVITQQ